MQKAQKYNDKNLFINQAATEQNPNWSRYIARRTQLYGREGEIRSPFARDCTRILHSNAYRRLKHKTQVFFNIENDHVCTRMEHVAHVESVSSSIAAYMGLNCELTRAIATGHDLGHAPFGHEGESVLNDLCQKHLGETFWHERNGLRFVDKVELLEDNYCVLRNLDLTYAVRDGIISHCGETDESGLKPRARMIDLESDFTQKGEYAPFTWEGCVVKIADKIAYVGRDIEDARNLGFLSAEDINSLRDMARVNDENAVNTTVIMHNMILDVCHNSSPEKGINFSPEFYGQLNAIKQFNYDKIYKNERLAPFCRYCRLVLNELFDYFMQFYGGGNVFARLQNADRPSLAEPFAQFLSRYCDVDILPRKYRDELKAENQKIYGDLSDEKTYVRAVIDFLSGMTDRYAVKAYEVLLNY